MNLAIQEARKAYQKNEVPIGCVIVSNNKVLAKSHNLVETNKDPLAHAEILAIKQAVKERKRWRLNSCDIYVTMQPCTMCLGAIYNSRIKNLYFSAFDSKGLDIFKLKEKLDISYNHKLNISNKIQLDICSNLVKSFFESKR
ncbi:MAG: nucleoside deaminase [archaeon]